MVYIGPDRTLVEEEFDYGNHTIEVRVKLVFNSCRRNVLNEGAGCLAYHRHVDVKARGPDGNEDVKERSYVNLEAGPERTESHLLGLVERTVGGVPGTAEQVEETVRPVLEALDELYTYTEPGVDVEMEVALHRVEQEVSWVEVDDAVDRLSAEIDGLAGAGE